jgi:hypothetical protein
MPSMVDAINLERGLFAIQLYGSGFGSSDQFLFVSAGSDQLDWWLEV